MKVLEKPRSKQKGNSSSRLGQEIWGLLLRLLRSERLTLAAVCHDHEITPPQAFLLKHLEPQRPAPMNEFAEVLMCDASYVTSLVDKLEARGIIQRQSDPADRRVKMIALTESGAKFRESLLKRLLQPPPSVAALPESEKRTLRNILQRAVSAAEQSRRLA